MRKALIRVPPEVSRGKYLTVPLMIHKANRACAWWSGREQKALNSDSLVAGVKGQD